MRFSHEKFRRSLLGSDTETSYCDPLAATLGEISNRPPLPRWEQEGLFTRLTLARRSVDRLITGLPITAAILTKYIERPILSTELNGSLKGALMVLKRGGNGLDVVPADQDLKREDLRKVFRNFQKNRRVVLEIIESQVVGPRFSTPQALALAFYRWCVAQKRRDGNAIPNNLRGDEVPESASEQAKDFKHWLLSQNVDWMDQVPAHLRTIVIDSFLTRYARVSALRDEAVARNLGLAVAMAKRLVLRQIALVDAIDEGKIAIMRAVDNFDEKRNFQFSTYCCRAIIKAILRADRKLEQIAHREPVHIDRSISHHSEHSLVVLLEDTRAPQSDAEIIRSEELMMLKGAMGTLTHVEQEVIRYRFGIDDYPYLTLEEMGSTIGVTKERVRQIELKALKKMHALLSEPSESGEIYQTPEHEQTGDEEFL